VPLELFPQYLLKRVNNKIIDSVTTRMARYACLKQAQACCAWRISYLMSRVGTAESLSKACCAAPPSLCC
jgi:hypothetical protein